MRRHRPSAALVLAATALVVAIGGTAIAAVGAIPADGRFTACYQTSDSLLDRIVLLAEPGEQCPNTYARVSWPSQAGGGAQGPQGPTGPAGPAGPAGAPGPRGPSGSSASNLRLTLNVVQRRVTLDNRPDATVRCAAGMSAVGGGGEIHSGGYMLRDSVPLVEKRVPVGWSVQPKAVQRFAFKTVDGGQLETALAAAHRHKYTAPPLYYPLEGRGPPAEVTVYAICARLLDLSVAKKRTPGKGTTRSGG